MAIDATVRVRLSAADRSELRWSDRTGDLPGDPVLNELVASVLRTHPDWAHRSWTVTSTADARAGAGLGSSGAFLVALAGLLSPDGSADELARTAYHWEHRQADRMVGPQDSFASAHGGIGTLAIGTDGEVRVSPLTPHPRSAAWIDNNLLLFDTGISRDASRIVAAAKQDDDQRTQEDGTGRSSRRTEQLHAIRALVAPFRQALEEGDVDRFGPLLTENWKLKAGMGRGVSTPRAEELLALCLSAGAHGGKLVGAGGGGYVLVSVPDRALHAVRTAMGRAHAPELPFRLSPQGVRADRAGSCEPAADKPGGRRRDAPTATPRQRVAPLAGDKELS
ncbi:GHMP family kinase ATP-binding protein [Streptomyces griseoloalbus]|uniref:D-glycero-alpha-D-manno-heptose-7-phosphate kinase n=2 Tax=Streptomyces griseoloalbus TaxID=67303 RepID=A0A7W8FE98_9ACTN|nr:hypothetical protein [Streptomyces albaduncus]MBB5130291.1 D-glycero-alpha-D-manno-heptose-7-phosphate kinase [Streptomyces albaduncus]